MQIVSLSRTEQARQAILFRIVSGEFGPGERLLEAKLAAELGVSQATVNAALQDLHNQGLVTKLLNRSTRVSRYTGSEIEKLFAVRDVLEPCAAAAVASSWSAEAERRLTDHVDQMRRAAQPNDLAKFCLADYLFHQEIYALAGNSFLLQACQAIAAAPFAYILCDRLQPLPTDYLALAEDHQELVRAMQQGPETAARVTRSRIREWLAHSLRAITETPAAAKAPARHANS